jgi:hypothetical protein
MTNLYKRSCFIVASFLAFLVAPAQIIINEISPDAGNNDGTPANQTAEFIELYNAGASAVNIGCWVLSDGQSWIRIPSGANIAAGGVYLLSSSGYPSAASIGTGSTGINCPTCDFAGLPINLDWGPAGAAGIRTGNNLVGNPCLPPNPSTGSAGNRDEAWVLFNTAGTIVNAVYFGNENNACAIVYPVNSPALTGLSGCSDEPAGKFVVPGVVFDGTNNNGYTYAGPQLNGCNSSYQRIPDGSTWANGNINNATYPFGTQPTTQPTNHPTPGKTNSSAPFVFSGTGTGGGAAYVGQSTYTMCSSGNITFTYVVNNYQNVQPTKTYDATKIGSFVAATGAGSLAATNWASVSTNTPSAGQTTLTYTVSPPLGTTTYELVWEDFILNCCGSSSPSVTTTLSSSSWECYERKAVTITRNAAMTASKTTIDCPTDFPAGTVDISTLMLGGGSKTYQLKDNGINVGSANTTGVFSLSNTLGSPLTVVVTDLSACTAPITININNTCKLAPVCPTIVLSTATTTASGNKCPADVINLCVDNAASGNLPISGTLEWHSGTTAGFDPFTTPNLITTQNIANACVSGPGNVKINELGIRPAANDGSGGEFMELFNAGCTPVNIGCYTIAYKANSSSTTWTIRIPSGTNLAACSYYLIGGNFVTTPDLNYSTCVCTSGTSPGNLNNTAAQVFLINSSDVIVDQVAYGTVAPTGTTTTSAAGGGCTASTAKGPLGANTAGLTTAPPASQGASYSGSAWSYQANTSGASNAGGQAACTPPKGVINTCAAYTLTTANCNNGGNLFYKGIVKPIDGSCSQPNATTAAAGAYTVTCPTATLTGGGAVCNGTGTPATVNLVVTASASLNLYTFNYLENGTATSVGLSGASPYTIAVSTVGSYEAVSLTPPGGSCAGTITGTAEVTRKVPALSTSVEVCVSSNAGMLVFPVEPATQSPVSFTSTNANAPTTNSSGSFKFAPALTGTIQTFTMNVNTCSASTTATVICDATAPIALPIRLLYFNGNVTNGKVWLSWSAVLEELGTAFEIQRSQDGIQFAAIGKIDALNIIGTSSNYSFTDNQPLAGLNYYRLRIIEPKGPISFSKILPIKTNETVIGFSKVEPNPFEDFITITINAKRSGMVTIKLLTNTGMAVKRVETNMNAGVSKLLLSSLTPLAAGIYVVLIEQEGMFEKHSVIKKAER